jgi:hypothetical protein
VGIVTCDDLPRKTRSDHRWAWSNIPVAKKLLAASLRLRNWQKSIEWLATQTIPSAELLTPDRAVQELLDAMAKEESFMSGVIHSYMEETRRQLESIRFICSEPPGEQPEEDMQVVYKF